ncbi:hypothetical protein P43SY_000270 [Pythium insidiosum]|uniref:Uncharacterized protein n=1 Tax=Pythium insidiosum TaxID=114742 RepID=A0AAD5Q908_PYTIN|nr:hypothetical protein P43SY_000270 [Pythium insidiosum]
MRLTTWILAAATALLSAAVAGVLDASEPHLVKEFAYTGSSAEPRVGLLVDSTNNFKYYCTGRRFCSRLVVDLELKNRHDLFSRVLSTVISTPDYLTFDIGLNALDLDPIVFAISKKKQFNALVKLFPELVSLAKRLPSNDVPESFCVASDNIETPKTAMTRQLVKHLETLEPFLDYFVISDVSSLPVAGFPNSEKRILRIRFALQNGSAKLDKAAAVAFMAYLIDAIGSTMKLSRDLKLSAQKKRTKYALERGTTNATQTETLARTAAKKGKDYQSLSYEEQQKLDEQQHKREMRKRLTRKK